MSGFDNNSGTTQPSFAVAGPLGPAIANDTQAPSPLGVIAALDNTGINYAPVRVADAALNNDAVNLETLIAAFAAVDLALPMAFQGTPQMYSIDVSPYDTGDAGLNTADF